MSFLSRVARFYHRDMVRSPVMCKELGVEPLPLHIERNHIRWLGLSGIPNQEEPPGKTPDMLAWELPECPWNGLCKWLGRGRFGPCVVGGEE